VCFRVSVDISVFGYFSCCCVWVVALLCILRVCCCSFLVFVFFCVFGFGWVYSDGVVFFLLVGLGVF